MSALPVLALSVLLAVPASGADAPTPSLVVTTEVLGAVASDLVADDADVRVLMNAGADPHAWQPSARDSETVFGADLIVANGLGLEEGLVTVLEQAEADGVPVFRAGDHVAVRVADAGDAGHDAGDPHFWLDPLAMRDVVLALAAFMAEEGLDVSSRATTLSADLEALDAEISAMLDGIPEDRRELVTGHGALGWFADRYGFRVVGTVVPGLSSSDEPSAREIAELIASIRESGASAIFTDVGTPPSVAQAVAAETGASVVELHVAQLPGSGDYADLLRVVAASIAGALGETEASADPDA